jgi:hypothetical protein
MCCEWSEFTNVSVGWMDIHGDTAWTWLMELLERPYPHMFEREFDGFKLDLNDGMARRMHIYKDGGSHTCITAAAHPLTRPHDFHLMKIKEWMKSNEEPRMVSPVVAWTFHVVTKWDHLFRSGEFSFPVPKDGHSFHPIRLLLLLSNILYQDTCPPLEVLLSHRSFEWERWDMDIIFKPDNIVIENTYQPVCYPVFRLDVTLVGIQ